jgi:hypothetical protein
MFSSTLNGRGCFCAESILVLNLNLDRIPMKVASVLDLLLFDAPHKIKYVHQGKQIGVDVSV